MPGQPITQLQCHKCGAPDHLEPCIECHKPVCPKCRWGTGSLSDGYTCIHCEEEDTVRIVNKSYIDVHPDTIIMLPGPPEKRNNFTAVALGFVFTLMLGVVFFSLL